jgi:hypothetical protein
MKYIFIALSMIIMFSHLHAMKREKDIIITKPCLFIYLPSDIIKLITDFVTSDSEQKEEFIERTKKILPMIDIIPIYWWRQYLWLTYGLQGYSLISSCTNNNIYAILYCSPSPTLVIIDLKKNLLLHKKSQDSTRFYEKIALSHDGTAIAMIHTHYIINRSKKTYNHTLTIKNIITQKTKNYDLSLLKFIYKNKYPLIDFNKQGTDIIIHGAALGKFSYRELSAYFNNRNSDPIPHHVIFPVITHAGCPNPNTKTLENYFARKMVCKKFVKQLTL